jgi:outer membrane receptor for Fe3+-dicitrate
VKLGANYNIDNHHNVFANMGYISNVPKFKNGAFMSANTSHTINPDAKNEQILSAELGYGYHNSWINLKLNGYITNWKDKAMFKKGSFANKEQYVINMTGVDALHMGVELEAFIRPTRWLDIVAMLSIGDWRWASKSAKGYAYDLYGNALTSDGEITSVGADNHASASINMANVPVGGSAQTTGALELIFKPYKDLYLAVGGTVYDRNYAYYSFSGSNLSLGKELSISEPWVIPTYATMDVRLGYTFDIKGLPVTLSGGVNNLLDNHYIEKAWDPSNISKSSSLPDPSKVYLFYSIGRTWNLSLKFQF